MFILEKIKEERYKKEVEKFNLSIILWFSILSLLLALLFATPFVEYILVGEKEVMLAWICVTLLIMVYAIIKYPRRCR